MSNLIGILNKTRCMPFFSYSLMISRYITITQYASEYYHNQDIVIMSQPEYMMQRGNWWTCIYLYFEYALFNLTKMTTFGTEI